MDFLNESCAKSNVQTVGVCVSNASQITNNKSSEIEAVCREQKELTERLYEKLTDLRQRLSPVLTSQPPSCCSERKMFQAPLAVFISGSNGTISESIAVLDTILDTLQM